MLAQLNIRHFAIIDSCEMELHDGMTALTGETGAGKSILLDALGLVLGDRAEPSSVKQNEQRAEITALFTPPDQSPVWQWLEAHDLDDEDNCILRRLVMREGKSRAYINGRAVTLQMLRTVGEMLIDIHGQHEHQSLTRRSAQRDLLDSVAANRRAVDQCEQAFVELQALEEQLAALHDAGDNDQQRVDMLQFQIQEFDALGIDPRELASIEQDHVRLSNASRLLELGNSAVAALEDSDMSAYQQLITAQHALNDLAQVDKSAGDATELVESALINCSEAASSLRDYLSSIDMDNERLGWLEERLSTLHRLAKKHRVEISELPAEVDRLRTELDGIESTDNDIEKLETQSLALREIYHQKSATLTRQREKSARQMNKAVSGAMASLGMEGGVYECQLDTDTERVSRHGYEDVHFMVSPNPGVAPGDISKIASGGELSRISLAVQLFTTRHESVNAFIFDEVDSGIGGAVAETVGRYLRTLSAQAQVLCVTHLPQVAAQAHHHLQVSKHVSDGKTSTVLTELDETATIEELARMLGGKRITRKSRQHASEMRQQAAEAEQEA